MSRVNDVKRFRLLCRKECEAGDGLSEAEYQEYRRLHDELTQSQRDSSPRPDCCEAMRSHPTATLSVEFDDEVDSLHGACHWRGLWFDKQVTHFPYKEMPDVSFCAYCGSKLPEMRRKARPPKGIAVIVDGGYYCNTCRERLDNCLCLLPQAAFERVP